MAHASIRHIQYIRRTVSDRDISCVISPTAADRKAAVTVNCRTFEVF